MTTAINYDILVDLHKNGKANPKELGNGTYAILTNSKNFDLYYFSSKIATVYPDKVIIGPIDTTESAHLRLKLLNFFPSLKDYLSDMRKTSFFVCTIYTYANDEPQR